MFHAGGYLLRRMGFGGGGTGPMTPLSLLPPERALSLLVNALTQSGCSCRHAFPVNPGAGPRTPFARGRRFCGLLGGNAEREFYD